MSRLVEILAVSVALLALVNCDVKVHWMDYTDSEWTTTYESKVKSAVASQLNEYCSDSDCKITRSTSTNISTNDITFSGLTTNSYTIDGRFIIVKVSATVDNQVLTDEVLNAFMVARRENIVLQGGVAIAYINDVLVYPARDQTDNYVIITLFTTITIGLFVLNLVLTKKSNEEEKLKELTEKCSELKPFIKQPDLIDDAVTNNELNKLTEASKTSKQNQSNKSISRVESFDQKMDPKLNPGKHRKRHRSDSNGSTIAGHVGSGIGSTRNMAEEEKW